MWQILLKGLLFLFLLTESSYTQYKMEIVNGKLDNNIFEFDIFINSTDDTFPLISYQGALDFNKEIINNGNLTFSYIEGSSQLVNEPLYGVGIQYENDIPRLCFASGCGNDMIDYSSVRIGSFRLENSEPFSPEEANINWNFNGHITTIIMDSSYNEVSDPSNHFNLINSEILPVELVSFKSEIKNNSVELKWVTATETNFLGFEIERKRTSTSSPGERAFGFLPSEGIDSENWEVIDFVKSKGGTEPASYSFSDNSLKEPGIYFYRLKQIDLDGTFDYSNEIEVKLNNPDKFMVYQNYPNPFNPTTIIKFSLISESKVKIKIFDSISKLIEIITDNAFDAGYHEVIWDAGNLSSGIYFYVVEIASTKNNDAISSVNKMILLK